MVSGYISESNIDDLYSYALFLKRQMQITENKSLNTESFIEDIISKKHSLSLEDVTNYIQNNKNIFVEWGNEV